MEPTPTNNESCSIGGACAGPRCPFARLFGTAAGRASLVVLVLLGVVHYFAPDPVAVVALVLMWSMALALCGWVLIGGRRKSGAAPQQG